MPDLLTMALDEAFALANASHGFPEDERTRELRVRCEQQVIKETRPFWGNPALFTKQARAPLRTMEGGRPQANISGTVININGATDPVAVGNEVDKRLATLAAQAGNDFNTGVV